MTFFEKFAKTIEPKHWLGDMEADHYIYSAGIGGQRFFEALRDEGKILGAQCKSCNIAYVPPRIYCEKCFAELSEKSLIDVGLRGRVKTFTVARIGKSGQKLAKPEIFAVIEFGPNITGFLHKLGEVKPEQVKINMEVEAVLKPKRERQGKITDIAYFKPL